MEQTSNNEQKYYNIIVKIGEMFHTDASTIIKTDGNILIPFTGKKLQQATQLLDYIKARADESGKFTMNDDVVAKELNTTITTIFRWRKRLKECGLITCKIRCSNHVKYSEITLVK